MKATAVNAIPFPEDTDAPDGPTQIKALAELLDTLKWGSRNLKPTVGVKPASSGLVLPESAGDIPGAKLEITPAVPSTLLVIAAFDFTWISGSNLYAAGTIKLDSNADETPLARAKIAPELYVTVSQVYLLTLTAALHTIKMRGSRTSVGSGSGEAAVGGTRMMYALFAS